ncbi:hypothetical protein [Geoglobus sp.]
MKLHLTRFREIKIGVILLLLAATLALVSMYPVKNDFYITGVLNSGDVLKPNELYPEGELRDVRLVINSTDAAVAINHLHEGFEKRFSVDGAVELNGTNISLVVVKGDVSYVLSGKLVEYPYALFGYLAVILMISGSILVNLGLLKVFSER